MFVFLFFLAIIILFFLIILLAPLKICFNLNLKEYKISGAGSIEFVNPYIFSLYFDSINSKVNIIFIGRTIRKKDKREQKAQEDILQKEKSVLKDNVILQNKKQNEHSTDSYKSEEFFFKSDEKEEIKKEIKKEKIKKEKKSVEKEDKSLKIVFSLLRNNRWRKKILRWVKKVLFSFFKLISLDRFYLSIVAGVEDPAIVGYLFGIYKFFSATVPLDGRKKQIKFLPVFMKNFFEFDSTVSFSTSLLRIISPFFLAFFTFPLLDTFLLWRKAKVNLQ